MYDIWRKHKNIKFDASVNPWLKVTLLYPSSLPWWVHYFYFFIHFLQYYHHFYFAVEETGTNRLNRLLKTAALLVEVLWFSHRSCGPPKPMHYLSERDTETVLTVHYGVRLKSVLIKKTKLHETPDTGSSLCSAHKKHWSLPWNSCCSMLNNAHTSQRYPCARHEAEWILERLIQLVSSSERRNLKGIHCETINDITNLSFTNMLITKEKLKLCSLGG